MSDRLTSTSKRMQVRELLVIAQHGLCAWCGKPLPVDLSRADIDHIIPRCRGGPDEAWNRQLLHRWRNTLGGKGITLTPQAEALAAEHGVILVEPPPRKPFGYWQRPDVRARWDAAQV
jgi:hypothetical protein